MISDFLYGVISHQGDYSLHMEMLRKLGRRTMGVFAMDDFNKANALVIPGGESTTLIKFFDRLNLWDSMKTRITDGMPIFGTCAGLILLAKEINNNGQKSLGVMDIGILRNGYGRQVDSFESVVESPIFNGKPLKGVFIRAPRITKTGPDVEILASLDSDPVLVKSGKMLGATFHPELTDDRRVHALFVDIAENS